MRFLAKFLIYTLVALILSAMYIYTDSIGDIELNYKEGTYIVNLYIVLLCILLVKFALCLMKSIVNGIKSLFKPNDPLDIEIQDIAEMIVCEDYIDLSRKITRTEKMKPLRLAIELSKKCNKNILYAEKTGISCIDVLIIGEELKRLLDEGDINNSVILAIDAINKYPKYIKEIKYELLNVAQIAKRNGIKFTFDPRMFKYNLSEKYIAEYIVSIALIEAENESDDDKKLKIIKKLHNEYPDRIDVLCKLLNFNIPDKIKLKAISETISYCPDRVVSKYLLMIETDDIYEQTKNMLSSIPDSNLEKIWILFHLAVKKQYEYQSKILMQKIIDLDKTNSLLEYIKQDEFVYKIFKEVR